MPAFWGMGMCGHGDPFSAFFSSQDHTFSPKSLISRNFMLLSPSLIRLLQFQSLKLGQILWRNSVHFGPKFQFGGSFTSPSSSVRPLLYGRTPILNWKLSAPPGPGWPSELPTTKSMRWQYQLSQRPETVLEPRTSWNGSVFTIGVFMINSAGLDINFLCIPLKDVSDLFDPPFIKSLFFITSVLVGY